MRYRAYYSPLLLRRPLVQAYIHTKDRDSFIAILRQVHDSADRPVLVDEDSAGVLPDRTEVVGNFTLDVANFSRNRVACVESILQVSFISVKPDCQLSYFAFLVSSSIWKYSSNSSRKTSSVRI
jgi:hypothetical protein